MAIIFEKKPTKTKVMISSGKQNRLPRTRRVSGDQLPQFRLTKRDAEIIRSVYEYRALTTGQVAALHFADAQRDKATVSSRALHRLKLLYHHGFLTRAEQPQLLTEGRKPFVYWLDKRGAQLVASLDECDIEDLDWRPNEYSVQYQFLAHLLATNDVRIAITLAAKKHGFTLREWLDERNLKRRQMTDKVTLVGPHGGKQSAAVVPDGYFLLETPTARYHHFLEVDLRTVTGEASTWGRRDIARKTAAYLAYYRSGKYQERYHTQGLRVLWVTTGQRRLANLKGVIEKAGGRSRFWLTTLEHATTHDILTAPIWQVASQDDMRALTG